MVTQGGDDLQHTHTHMREGVCESIYICEREYPVRRTMMERTSRFFWGVASHGGDEDSERESSYVVREGRMSWIKGEREGESCNKGIHCLVCILRVFFLARNSPASFL